MATAFLAGPNQGIYGVLLNELHNAFRVGCDKYLKMLTASYNLEINWKGYTKGSSMAPNDGMALTIILEEADVHATNGMKMT